MLVLAFIAIIIGTTMPNDMKIQVSNQVATQIHTVNDTFSPVMALYLTKAGHFCFFVLFGLFLSMLLNRESAILVLGHILLLAGAAEIAQFYIDGRSPLILDFVLDASGGLVGLIVMKLSSLKKTEIKSIP